MGVSAVINNKFKYNRRVILAKFIIPMLKNQTVNINANQLSLHKYNTHHPDNFIVVNFQPIKRPDQPFESIIPHFNHDRQFYTPAFLIPPEQKFYRENLNFEKLKFQERIQNAQEKHILQNNYKFQPPSNYCQICKLTYPDYLEHINQPQHRQILATSPVNLYIQELVGKYPAAGPKEKKIVKGVRRERGCRRELCRQQGWLNKRSLANYSKSSNQSTMLLSQII